MSTAPTGLRIPVCRGRPPSLYVLSDTLFAVRLSADAYIQMALQLAWYRDQGSFTATYETALTRLFRNGRTETIRTFSSDSRAFVLAMVDPSATVSFSALRYGSLLTNGCRSRTRSRCFDVQSQRTKSSRGTLLPGRVLTGTYSGLRACQLPVTLSSSRTLFSVGLKSGSSAQVLLVPVIFSEAPGMPICFLYLLFIPDCCLLGLVHPIMMDMGSTVSASCTCLCQL
jgi:hypothetical protein